MNRARVNEQIRIPEVRLIDAEGQQVGVMPTDQAKRMAEESELDLVEVAANARPPVCRIMNYSKFLFEEQKKERAARKKQRDTAVETKEIRLRPGTDAGDLKIKAEHARKFLEEGYKVGIQLQFRGREMAHRELGIEAIHRFAEMLDDISKIEQEPKLMGRRMNALLASTIKS
ncbi:MAG: translation initiation factor IF-3 [Planctomycetota bacterium]